MKEEEKKEEVFPELEDNPGDHVGRALLWLRQESGLTQRELAQRAHALQKRDRSRKAVLESQLSDFERGRAKPSHDALVAVLAALSPDERCDFGRYQEALDQVRGLEAVPPEDSAPAALRVREPTSEALGVAATLSGFETELTLLRAEVFQLQGFRQHMERVLELAQELAQELERAGRAGPNGHTGAQAALASVDYVFGDRR